MFRPAGQNDIDAVTDGYEALLIEEEKSGTCTNRVRGLYPTRRTALHAAEKGCFMCGKIAILLPA